MRAGAGNLGARGAPAGDAGARAARAAATRAASRRTRPHARPRPRAPAKVVRGGRLPHRRRRGPHGRRNAFVRAAHPSSPTSHGAGATSVPPSAAAKPSWCSTNWFQRCASRRIQDSAAPARGIDA